MQQSKQKKTRFICLLIGMVMLVGLLAGCGSDNDDNEVVAIYEGGEVTKGEFTQYKEVLKVLYGDMYTQLSMMNPNFDESILQQMIGYKLLTERATEEQREEAKAFAETDWNQFRNALEMQGRLESLEEQLEEANIKDEQLIEIVSEEIASLFYYRDQVEEADLQAYYDELLEENEHVFDRATVRHVLIQTFNPQTEEEILSDEEGLARANEVREKYLDGEAFEDLVAEYSDDLASVPDGGLMVDEDVNMWVENFKNAVIELPLNEISEPVKTEYGYHVMIVEDRRTVELDELKDGIRTSIAQDERHQFITEELPEIIDEDSINLPDDES